MSNISISKVFAIQEEFRTTERLIFTGLGEIQNISLDNDFYFLPFQLLSQGFERFMKLYVCLSEQNQNSQFPDNQELKKLGHNLKKILSIILNEHFVVDTREQIRLDQKFLSKDKGLDELLYILSEFGKLARYHNFSVITGSEKTSVNPQSLWEKYESRILSKWNEYPESLVNDEKKHEVYGRVSQSIVVTFEKFISALSRQMIMNHLGSSAKQFLFSSKLCDLGMIYEGEFGVKDYRTHTSGFVSRQTITAPRTLTDEANRLGNPNYKSKRVTKSAYRGDWPFTSNQVIVEQRHEKWCVVTIENRDYALNGLAKGRYKLETAHEGGMAILGISTQEFLKMAQAL